MCTHPTPEGGVSSTSGRHKKTIKKTTITPTWQITTEIFSWYARITVTHGIFICVLMVTTVDRALSFINQILARSFGAARGTILYKYMKRQEERKELLLICEIPRIRLSEEASGALKVINFFDDDMIILISNRAIRLTETNNARSLRYNLPGRS